MPPKLIKTSLGKHPLKAIRLPNGSLLCPGRSAENRKEFAWIEAAPGTSLFKRWAPVAVAEPDPRIAR